MTQYKAFQALGCRVVAADCDPASVGFHFADAAYVVPRVGAPAYLERMLAVCQREAVDRFLPALDEELAICGEHRARFEALGTRIMLSSPRALSVCADKLRMYQCFKDLGIPTARTVAAEDYREGLFERFPLIVNLTITEDFFLANWRHSVKVIAALAGASILVLLAAFWWRTRH